MLYHYNRPVNQQRRTLAERFFQWRTFKSDTQDLREKIESDFKSVKSETRTEKYFLIPGRRNVMPRMIDDELFEVRSKLNDNEPVELWERSISTSFPMKRTTSATIGSAIPRFRGSLNSVATPDSLCESLQRKSKYFEAKKSREVFKKGKVTAEISEIEIDGEIQYSIAIQSTEKKPIMDLIEAYGLKSADNTNIADHLLTA
ncbi:hypothetical protein [Hellea balneolensis]|uniref:hypothetical protein n=1 Tax=Hellea balneolensis TaxID=287478 RepID=UPI00040FD85B|nr:hypothetical protein [Hellea balneolensis]